MKFQIVERLVASGVVAVVRAQDENTAAAIADACAQGGIQAIEITLTVPGALRVIDGLSRKMAGQLIIGAGTVLDPETARAAMLSGAQFIVSPALNTETARLCHRYQIPYLPGCGTVSEIIQALEAGADLIKVFPGETLGPAFVKAVLGPLPQAPLMPTGGVSIDNAAEWIRAGSVALGAGSSLTAGAARGDFESITTLAKQYLERIKEARAERSAERSGGQG